jgi:predicted GIY-YIG superfamily endonuclease
MKTWTVYILECGDGSYYTGITNDLPARAAAHAAGKGGKYTRSRLPVRVVHRERRATKGAALKREAAIKKLTRAQKEMLVSGHKR